MPNDLPVQLDLVLECLEALMPQIEASGSDEQRQLVRAMQDSLLHAAPHYDQIPEYNNEQFRLWRHNTVGPLGLCINSAELLLTDDVQPLREEPRRCVQCIYDTALKINSMIDEIFEQRTGDKTIHVRNAN